MSLVTSSAHYSSCSEDYVVSNIVFIKCLYSVVYEQIQTFSNILTEQIQYCNLVCLSTNKLCIILSKKHKTEKKKNRRNIYRRKYSHFCVTSQRLQLYILLHSKNQVNCGNGCRDTGHPTDVNSSASASSCPTYEVSVGGISVHLIRYPDIN